MILRGMMWVLVVLGLVACHESVRSTDGSTSWLEHCATDDDCGARSCVCGVCTTVCAVDAVCTEEGSRCAKSASSAFGATCGAASTLAGVCLPECPATGCGEGRDCVGGQCVMSVSASIATHDAGSGGAPGGGGTTGDGGTTGLGGTIPVGMSGATGNGATSAAPPPGSLASCTDLTPALGTRDPVSFRNDLLPIFGQNCTASDCHNVHDNKAGLNLGYKCAYDQNAKWKCTFPVTGSGDDVTMPQPDDEQTIAKIYTDLLAVASTVNDGAMRRVAPGDPANSFIILKLSDRQNASGLACTNQDPTRDMTPCGGLMPLTGTALCEGTSQPRFDAIATWIAQGAPNN